MARSLLFALILAYSWRTRAEVFILEKSGLSSIETQQAKHLVEKITPLVPRKITEVIGSSIRVKFEHIPKTLLKSDKVWGKIELAKRRIILDLQTLSFDPKVQETDYSNTGLRFSMINALHEVVHLFDQLSKSPKNKKKICPTKDRNVWVTSGQSYTCRLSSFGGDPLSSDPQFLALTQWQPGESLYYGNKIFSRLPQAHAATSPRESFAVYLSHALVDTDFACRFPQMELYFSKLLGTKDRLDACVQKVHWFQMKKDLSLTDLSRVHAVDFLWASEGRDSASSYGHSMLRLVICAPDRLEPSDLCYQDTFHHIVLTYSGSTREVEFGKIKGVMGAYPLNLYSTPFIDKVVEYNYSELRDLYAVPLKLDPTQIKTLLYHLNFENWAFEGVYYYAGRNCTTEVLRALVASGVDLDLIDQIYALKPSDVFRNLLSSKLADLNSSSQLKTEKSKKLFFPSQMATFLAALEDLKTVFPNESFKTPQEYLIAVSSRDVQRSALQTKFSFTGKTLTNMRLLEEFRLYQIEKAFSKLLADLDPKVLEKMAKLSESVFFLKNPTSFITDKAYGLFREDEFEEFGAKFGSAMESVNPIPEKFENPPKEMSDLFKEIEFQKQLLADLKSKIISQVLSVPSTNSDSIIHKLKL